MGKSPSYELKLWFFLFHFLSDKKISLWSIFYHKNRMFFIIQFSMDMSLQLRHASLSIFVIWVRLYSRTLSILIQMKNNNYLYFVTPYIFVYGGCCIFSTNSKLVDIDVQDSFWILNIRDLRSICSYWCLIRLNWSLKYLKHKYFTLGFKSRLHVE